VFTRQQTLLDPVCLPLERLIARLSRADPTEEMTARRYFGCFLLLGGLGALCVYVLLRLQRFLPWFFPAYHTTALSLDLAFNTAISFTTTTTWQAYSGENTMSYVSQMAALVTGNFLGGAAGLAIGIAFMRGFASERSEGIGNFWVMSFVRCSGSCYRRDHRCTGPGLAGRADELQPLHGCDEVATC
jgi:K+-transporting ATPase ATPase A chain